METPLAKIIKEIRLIRDKAMRAGDFGDVGIVIYVGRDTWLELLKDPRLGYHRVDIMDITTRVMKIRGYAVYQVYDPKHGIQAFRV